MAELTRSGATVAEKIAAYSGHAPGTPYASDSLSAGKSGICERDPLTDLSRVDRVTFCEQMLALALSSNYEKAFRSSSNQVSGGVIRFSRRNHFVMDDWLPKISGCSRP